MRIKYIAHSCFLIETADGTRIVTDPYEPGCYDGAVRYQPVTEEADIVLVSHDHPDHNWAGGVPGSPTVISEAGPYSAGGVEFLGVSTYHDTSRGSERGGNIIFRITADGLNLCHLGDLGHILADAEAASLKPVDVLLLPVGGFFAVGPEESDTLIGALEPKLVIPMHYKTDWVDFPIAPVEDFLAGREGVVRPGGSEADLTAGGLPLGTLVLEPSALP